jgi:hypothetical protein
MAKRTDDNRYKHFLQVLYAFSGEKTVQAFATACNRQVTNMSGYINGAAPVGERVAKSSWDAFSKSQSSKNNRGLFKAICEIVDLESANIPKSPGIYMLYNSSAQVIYIGQATTLRTEVEQTLKRNVPVSMRMGPHLKRVHPTIRELSRYISLYEIQDPVVRANMEALLIRVSINHTHNSNLGHIRET